MLGVIFVLQHTPLDIIVSPPSLVILPPLVAVVCVIKDVAVVVSVRIVTGSFEQLVSTEGITTKTVPPCKTVWIKSLLFIKYLLDYETLIMTNHKTVSFT